MDAGNARGIVRQGDVLLVPVDGVPPGAGTTVERGVRFVLAEGEATGHAHVVLGPATLVSSRARRTGRTELHVVVEDVATLVHDEHDAIPLERGAYRVVRQREYEPRTAALVRRVAD
jgi:hypothetical protein